MSDVGRIDFKAMAERARRMQGELAQVQEDLAAIQATGYGDGGLVTATVSAEGRILDLRFDSSVIDPDDPERLSRLVIEAIEEANQGIAEQRTQRFSGVAADIGGMLEGLNGSALGTVRPKAPQGLSAVEARRRERTAQ